MRRRPCRQLAHAPRADHQDVGPLPDVRHGRERRSASDGRRAGSQLRPRRPARSAESSRRSRPESRPPRRRAASSAERSWKSTWSSATTTESRPSATATVCSTAARRLPDASRGSASANAANGPEPYSSTRWQVTSRIPGDRPGARQHGARSASTRPAARSDPELAHGAPFRPRPARRSGP